MSSAVLRNAPASPAHEQRASSRHLMFRTGKIVSLHDDKEIIAAVLDLSKGGACLLVSNILIVPDRFQFIADCVNESYCCEVRWKAGHKVGIRFVGGGDGSDQAEAFFTAPGR